MLCVSQHTVDQMIKRPSFLDHLREYSTPSDFAEAADQTAASPDLLPIHDAVNRMKEPTQWTRLRLFSFPIGQPVFWFALIENKLENPFILMVRNPNPVFDSATFEGALGLFLAEIAKNVRGTRAITTIAERCLACELARLLPTFLPSHSSITSKPFNLFHMRQSQIVKLNELELSPPYGYSFDNANDDDAEVIAETSEGSLTLEAARGRLSSLPYVLIRGPHGTAVCHELSSPAGGLTHLFTQADHRRIGLGTMAEMKLAQNLARSGVTPFKAVCTYNTSVHRSSMESSFWTLLNRNGTPVDFIVEEFGLSQ
ncbi:hypothetical protein PRIPAC_72685 [Pristionchus pacificus]|uniref:Glycine N-acyltransferase-like protein n=1 Tax=Pristionchus pacificus TaxID=54126 RepID=A0A454XSC6_PRIPA|nr:hypothetical protein PRIPAC_72685 [Pristionchus pacificus]|eukprot:PDM76691.1 hypothetical protein PRIPAC_42086 [Pristionchus pacificus]